jgi:6-pyruvoyltetrahydropterin/6-carboxytetrahydropterin synthase
MFTVEINHNFEAAHRLYGEGSPEKCVSIHGHSWQVTATLCGDALDANGILIEFGAFKRAWRAWLDDHLDHHLILCDRDPMGDAIRAVYPQSRILALPQNPTTEVLAAYIFAQTQRVLAAVPGHAARLLRVHVQETRVNAAAFQP